MRDEPYVEKRRPYFVTITETVTYSVCIEGSNENDVIEEAHRIFDKDKANFDLDGHEIEIEAEAQ